MKLRKEFDSIGSVKVPNDKYWGASTQRSNKFFNIGKILVNISIIKSIAIIKRSAAIVHAKDKLITPLTESYHAVIWHCIVSHPMLQKNNHTHTVEEKIYCLILQKR